MLHNVFCTERFTKHFWKTDDCPNGKISNACGECSFCLKCDRRCKYNYIVQYWKSYNSLNFKVTSLENNMLEPGDYVKPCGVLNIGYFIIMWLYMMVGLFGFIKYGDREDMGASITLDIPVDNP